jgi:putative peptidoglycan lipid II flippase
MVKRIFSIFHREISGLHQAAYLLGFFALCSQVLALFRDRLLAAHFGATGTLDLYYSAFRIPDFLFATVASVVSISVLMPYLMERMERSSEEAKKFVDAIFSFFFLFMFVVGILAFWLAPFFLKILFPPFALSASFGSLVALTRILLLSPIFLGFSNMLATIVQINKRFFLYSMSPIVYNLGIIFGILFLYPIFGLSGLGIGVALGAFFHFAIQLPFIIKQGLLPRFHFPIDFKIIKNVVYTSIPRTLTVSSNEIAELVLISFASFLVPGSISIFNFSFNLQSVPFSIIGVSYSLAAFPTLTKFFSKGNIDMFIDHMITSSRHIIFWSVPVSVLFVVLRAQIVRVILGSGKFNWGDTRLTAAALAVFVSSLVFQNLTPLFVRSYYSRGKTKIPLYMNMFSSALIIGLAYYLVHFFNHNIFFQNFIESLLKVSGVSGTAMLMLPLGFSLGVLVNCVIHWIGFGLEFRSFSKPVLRTSFEVVGSSIIMGFVAYLGLNFFGPMTGTVTTAGVFLQGFLSGVSGIIVAILILYLLKSKELSEVWSTLHKKIWKATVVGPDAAMD